MANRTTTQTAPRHSLGNQHLGGRHSADRRGGIPVSNWVQAPPQYHGGRHRTVRVLIARFTQALR